MIISIEELPWSFKHFKYEANFDNASVGHLEIRDNMKLYRICEILGDLFIERICVCEEQLFSRDQVCVPTDARVYPLYYRVKSKDEPMYRTYLFIKVIQLFLMKTTHKKQFYISINGLVTTLLNLIANLKLNGFISEDDLPEGYVHTLQFLEKQNIVRSENNCTMSNLLSDCVREAKSYIDKDDFWCCGIVEKIAHELVEDLKEVSTKNVYKYPIVHPNDVLSIVSCNDPDGAISGKAINLSFHPQAVFCTIREDKTKTNKHLGINVLVDDVSVQEARQCKNWVNMLNSFMTGEAGVTIENGEIVAAKGIDDEVLKCFCMAVSSFYKRVRDLPDTREKETKEDSDKNVYKSDSFLLAAFASGSIEIVKNYDETAIIIAECDGLHLQYFLDLVLLNLICPDIFVQTTIPF